VADIRSDSFVRKCVHRWILGNMSRWSFVCFYYLFKRKNQFGFFIQDDKIKMEKLCGKKKYVTQPLQNEGRWNYPTGKTAKGYTVI
jgi:hypothetical protein